MGVSMVQASHIRTLLASALILAMSVTAQTPEIFPPAAMAPSGPPDCSQPAATPQPSNTLSGAHPMGEVLEVLTPPDGIDFTNFFTALISRVKSYWLAVMPGMARGGRKGRVVVEFNIMSDGAISADEPKLQPSSGAKALDSAAMIAIRASASFQPLPPGFLRPSIRVRMNFNYNLPPGHTPRSAFNIPCRY